MKKIGWVGTGVMGKSMCRHLMKAGYPTAVHNRTREKASELLDEGAEWCDSPFEVAGKAEVVFTIVGFPQDVEEVYLGDDGVLAGLKRGSAAVDMTTSQPSLARRIHGLAEDRGISVLDAPVSGGDIGARDGRLAIMAGGNRNTYDEMLPLFRLMGENIAYMGPAGSGQHTKMSNQILIASTMIGVVESLIYGIRAGLQPEEIIAVIGKGAAASWSINNMGPRMIRGDFDPGFYIKHFVKDMGIALEEAKRMNLSLPGLSLAHQFYLSAMAMGLENLGTQGLYRVFEKMNGM
jgi:3-hydroxyisobutyrate dehydrogenase